MQFQLWLRAGRRVRPWMVAVALAAGGATACRSGDRRPTPGPSATPRDVAAAGAVEGDVSPDSSANVPCTTDDDCIGRFDAAWFCGPSSVRLDVGDGREDAWSRVCGCCRSAPDAAVAPDVSAADSGAETVPDTSADAAPDASPDPVEADDDGFADEGEGDFGVREAVARMRTPVVELAEATTIYGSLSPDVVRRALMPARRAIGRCYEAVLRADPSAAGRIVAAIDVDQRGRFELRAETEDQALVAAGLDDCVVRELRKLDLPRLLPAGTTLRYPFVFRPPE